MLLALDRQGFVLALFFGFLMYFFGGLSFLLLMLIFFFVAIGVTKYEHEIKIELGLYEKERGFSNVFSNGLLPTILAILSPYIGFFPFICSVAAVTADKFASEIGVLAAEEPRSIFTFKKVRPGTSGAFSLMGTFASLAGAGLIGFCSIYIFKISPIAALIATIAGFVGSLVDTILGYYEEKGIGTKETTNFFCSLSGALIGYLIK